MGTTLLLALASLWANSSASPVTYISIEEAVKKGLLQVEIMGRDQATDDDLDFGWGMHSGECIRMIATNKSTRPVSVMIETGRKLLPADSSVQDMIVTQQLAFTIPPTSKQEHLLYAMCMQMTDGSPDGDDAFALGLMAEPDLRGMASLIEKYNAQNETGQDAIWVITDDLDLSAIQGDDDNMVAALRHYAAGVTGKTIEPVTPIAAPTSTRYNVPAYSGSVEFGYRILQDSKVTLIVYNQDGEEFRTLFAEKQHEPGIYTIRYTLERVTMPPGVYTIKMYQDGNFKTFKQFRID